MRRRHVAAVTALSTATCLLVLPARANDLGPANGALCGMTSHADPVPGDGGVEVAEVHGGPLAATVPGEAISMRCTVQVGPANALHDGADTAWGETQPSTQATVLPPTVVQYVPVNGAPVYLCTQATVDGVAYYLDAASESWTTNPRVACDETIYVEGPDDDLMEALDPTVCVDPEPDADGLPYSPVPIDVGTGEHSYVPDPIGAIDSKWTVSVGNNSGNAYSVAPYLNAWYGGSTISNWISVAPDAEGGSAVYRIEFTVPLTVAYGGIVLRYAADNGVTFRLNGALIGGYPGGPTDTSAFQKMREISLAKMLLLPGANVLEAAVTNFALGTGFIVEGGVYPCLLRRGETP